MSHVALNSSFTSTHANLLPFVHSSNTTQSPAYVIGGVVGPWLANHPIVRLISFIGSKLPTFSLPGAHARSTSKSCIKEEMTQSDCLTRDQKIIKNYGKYFCDIVGVKTIKKLPEVNASQLNLDEDEPYPTIYPSSLKPHGAVKGMMESGRPFIAIRFEVLDIETKAIIYLVTELIFRRDGDEDPDLYYTSPASTENDILLPSSFRPYGAMQKEQLKAVRDVLEGKTIKIGEGAGAYLIRMAK